MKTDDLESRMRELEWFHDLRALPGTWLVLRVDGRSFTRLTEHRFEKPFDERFHRCMTETAKTLLVELHGVYAFTESDEISILLPSTSDLFNRKLEKLVSISAGIASACFSHSLGELAHFDSRLWLGTTLEQVVDYFRWRQTDATRCCLNGWCYWTLRKEGKTAKEASQTLLGKGVEEKNEMLFQRSINFNDLPTWQKRGTGLYWERIPKQGRNPMTGEAVTAIRRRVAVDREIPKGDTYGQFIRALLASSNAG